MGLLELILVIVLIFALIGPVSGWGPAAPMGYYPFGIVLVILLVVVLVRAI